MPEPARPTSSPPNAGTAQGPAAGSWFYARDKQRLGPFSWEQFRELARTEQLKPEDMVFQHGTQRWLTASAVPCLFPPSPPPRAPIPPSQDTRGVPAPEARGNSAPVAPLEAQRRAIRFWPFALLAFLLGFGGTIAVLTYLHHTEGVKPAVLLEAETNWPATPEEETNPPEPPPRQARSPVAYDRQLARVAVVWVDNPTQGLTMLNDVMACPPEQRDVAWHGYERLCRFDRWLLTKSHGEVTALAATPDLQLLASGGTDGMIRAWEVPSGQARGTLRGHTAAVSALAWRGDGKALLSGGRTGQLKYWDLQRDSEIKDHFHSSDLLPSKEGGGTIRALALAPDGRTAAVARQGDPQSATTEGRRVELWDAQTGKLRTILRDVAGPLAFSPDSRTLAVGGQLWDVDVGTPRSAQRQTSGEVRAVAFTADGTALALGVDTGQDPKSRRLDAQIWELPALRSVPR